MVNNPYWQIMENSSRNFSEIFISQVVTQAIFLENSTIFFEISHNRFGFKKHTVEFLMLHDLFAKLIDPLCKCMKSL